MRTFARQLLLVVVVAALVFTIDALVLRTHPQPEPTEHAAPRKARDEDADSLHAGKNPNTYVTPQAVDFHNPLTVAKLSVALPPDDAIRRAVAQSLDRAAIYKRRVPDAPIQTLSIFVELSKAFAPLYKSADLPFEEYGKTRAGGRVPWDGFFLSAFRGS